MVKSMNSQLFYPKFEELNPKHIVSVTKKLESSKIFNSFEKNRLSAIEIKNLLHKLRKEKSSSSYSNKEIKYLAIYSINGEIAINHIIIRINGIS